MTRTHLSSERLEDRCVPAVFVDRNPGYPLPPNAEVTVDTGPTLVAGSRVGGEVLVLPPGESAWRTVRPFGDSFTGAVSVAAAHLDGDGFAEVVAGAGAGGSPRVVVLDGKTGAVRASFLAFGADFAGGVTVAVGHVTGDYRAELIVAAGPGGGPHVKVFDAQTARELGGFYAYNASFRGGVRVTAADVDRDLVGEIVTAPGAGGGPNVRVFDGVNGSLQRSFFAFDSSYRGGVNVTAGDVDRDGYADVITGAAAGSSHVKVFGGKSGGELSSFYAFAPDLPGGVSVAAGAFNEDFASDIVVAEGSGETPQVRVLDGLTGESVGVPSVGDTGTGVSVGVAPLQVSISVPPLPPLPDDPVA